MRRRVWVALTVVVAALVAGAMPASAAHTTAVGSVHTTDSEFSNAASLVNASVSGTGSSARVVALEPTKTVDSAEDGDLSEYTVTTGSASATTAQSIDGSYSIGLRHRQSNTEVLSTSGLNAYPARGDNIRFRLYEEDFSNNIPQFRWAWDDSSTSGYELTFFGRGTDELRLRRFDSGTVTQLNKTTVDWSQYNDEWLEVEIDFRGDQIVAVVYDSTGTEIATLSATDTTYDTGDLELRGAGKSDSTSRVYFDAITVNRTTQSAEYVSQNHTVDRATQAWTNLSLSNASATVTWQGSNGGGWTDVSSTTYTNGGNKTISLAGSYSRYRVNTTFEATSGTTTAKLHDEGVLVETRSPTVDNSSLTPNTTSSTISSVPVTFEANVSDADFGTGHGDEVNVSFYINGTYRKSVTTKRKGTVSTSISGITAGDHQWHVEASDNYSHTQGSNLAYFIMPKTLFIYNESDPDDLVDEANVSLRIRFFQNDSNTVVERQISGGQVSMTGLDADSKFVVTVKSEGTEKYAYRRIIVSSLVDQNEIYLLPKSRPSADVTFEIDDATGNFPSETTDLFVEKPVHKDFDGDGTNETKYQIIVGDNFGASGEFPAVLAKDERYRLRVVNSKGDERILGAYTATANDLATIPIGQVSVASSADDQGYAFKSEYGEADIDNDGTVEEYIRVTYRDPERATETFGFNITRRGNTSNVVHKLETHTGPYGTFRATIEVNNPEGNKSYTVFWNATRDHPGDNSTVAKAISGQQNSGRVAPVVGQMPIDSRWLSVMGFVGIVAFVGFVGIASPRLGAVTGVLAGVAFTWLGIVSIPAAALGIAAVTALIYAIGTGGATAPA